MCGSINPILAPAKGMVEAQAREARLQYRRLSIKPLDQDNPKRASNATSLTPQSKIILRYNLKYKIQVQNGFFHIV